MNPVHKPRFLLMIICLFLVYSQGLSAQGYLTQHVSIGNIGRIRVETILQKMAQSGKFNFAYNNRVIPADSLILVTGYNGTLYNFLYQLLGNDYEFKEVQGYVVLRHAPNRLYIVADMEKDKSNELIIKGHVSDVNTKNDVGQVSVYEKDLLISTLTDDRGNFTFKVKNWNGSLVFTASKYNYRDTSLHLLEDVVINSSVSKKRYQYDPAEKEKRQKLERGLSRFFITSKQKIQDLNLGGLFEYSPYQISLTPGLSSHGVYNSQVIDNLSINLIGGYTAGIQGVEFGGVFNINRNNVGFLQAAGVFNVTGGSLKGIQLAGVYNQVLNNAAGVQAAGLVNKTHNFLGGVQMAGLANVSDSSKGVQLAGLANTSGTSKGIQVAGLFNRSREGAGSQVSSLVNQAKKVNGFQLGLINLADSSDYTIGLINLVKKGEKSLALSSDESQFVHLDFRSGGRILYGLVGVGYKLNGNPIKYVTDLGLGAHILRNGKFKADAEFVLQNNYNNMLNKYLVNAIEILPAYHINNHFKLFAGPALNLTSSNTGNNLNTGWVLHQQVSNNNLNVLSLGLSYGVQYIW